VNIWLLAPCFCFAFCFAKNTKNKKTHAKRGTKKRTLIQTVGLQTTCMA
jgi:hypothetical protein